MKRCLIIMAASLAMVSAMSSTAYAGSWKQDNVGWWWQNDDGSYPVSKWEWLDGNNDGVAESYCFDARGYMYADTTTPDGYTVNKDGQWTVDGVVQTKNVGSTGSGNGTTGTTQQTAQPASGSTNPADYGVSAERAQAVADILAKFKAHYGANFSKEGRKWISYDFKLNGFSDSEVNYGLSLIDWKAEALSYVEEYVARGSYNGETYVAGISNFRQWMIVLQYTKEEIEYAIANSGKDWVECARICVWNLVQDKSQVTTYDQLHDVMVNKLGFTEGEYNTALQWVINNPDRISLGFELWQ